MFFNLPVLRNSEGELLRAEYRGWNIAFSDVTLLSFTAAGKAHIRRTLLHEMCHVAVGWRGYEDDGEHGPLFMAEMLMLARRGEAWAHEELTPTAPASPKDRDA
jgi:hypothetical protein